MSAPALYRFTGETYFRRTRRKRWGNGAPIYDEYPRVIVTVTAPDQAAAERAVGDMLDIPSPSGPDSDYVDTYRRHFCWDRVEPAPPAEVTRAAELQAEAERERAGHYAGMLERVRALTFASDDGTPYDHNGHGVDEGEAECPGCWAADIWQALSGLPATVDGRQVPGE